MLDDRKRTKLICVKVTERMEDDLGRLASYRGRSLSDFIYGGMRQRMYGDIVRLEAAAARITSAYVVEDGSTQ